LSIVTTTSSDVTNQPAYLLDAAAMCLLRLRRAQKHKNMCDIRKVLQDIDELVKYELKYLESLLSSSDELYTSVVNDTVHVDKLKDSLYMCISAAEDEISLARKDLVQFEMKVRLIDALTCDVIPVAAELEKSQSLSTGSLLDLVELAAAISFCSSLFEFSNNNIGKFCCLEVIQLFHTAEVIMDIRQLYNGSKWSDLKRCVEGLNCDLCHPIAHSELATALRLATVNVCIEGAKRAYKIGVFQPLSSDNSYNLIDTSSIIAATADVNSEVVNQALEVFNPWFPLKMLFMNWMLEVAPPYSTMPPTVCPVAAVLAKVRSLKVKLLAAVNWTV
jgi:hypothetical protein